LVKFDEPFTKLLCQGMVLNHIYSSRTEKGGVEYFWPDEVENTYDAKGAIIGARLKANGREISYGGVGTMSKSKNNGVDPQSLIENQGADTARLFVMFTSPPEQTLEWSDAGVDGSFRFLRRLWSNALAHQPVIKPLVLTAPGAESINDDIKADSVLADLRRTLHSLLKQADYDYERIQYNTVVSACMKMLNAIEGAKLNERTEPSGAVISVASEAFSILLRVLYPVVPHITWQLWRDLGFKSVHGDILDTPWPTVDPSALEADTVALVLQVNGKLRGNLTVASDADKASIEALAIEHEAVQKHLEGRPPKRVIVVPGKLVNVVG